VTGLVDALVDRVGTARDQTGEAAAGPGACGLTRSRIATVRAAWTWLPSMPGALVSSGRWCGAARGGELARGVDAHREVFEAVREARRSHESVRTVPRNPR